MANSAFEKDALIKRAWNILLPSCVQDLVREDSFGLGPTQTCTPDKFYDILYLWWNQQLHRASLNKLQPNHLNVLKNYVNSNNKKQQQSQQRIQSQDWKCPICGANNHKTHVICDQCFTDKQPQNEPEEEKTDEKNNMDDISNYLGFFQPKNGVCGLVAGLHAILLYKMWDQVINESMQQMTNQPIKPVFDYKYLMVSTITHALITSANTASHALQYNPKIAQQTTQKSKPSTWICKHCQTNNNSANIFCKTCWKEPGTVDDNDTNQQKQQTNNKDMKTIEACSKIQIITDGELPMLCDKNNLLFYNEQLFGFNIHCIDYDKNDIESSTERVMRYLLHNIDFEKNFIDKGSCIRILLSLILTHGVERCEYELLLQEYEEIYRQFRDESLILGPYGFCSQNLVNLTMFGHVKPVIDSPQYLSFPYGFLGHDVINPGATGFTQIGYGYEYPMYPIWVVLSGTHYTTLFALPTHIQSYNNQHVLDCYHSMIKWINEHNKTDKKNKTEKKDEGHDQDQDQDNKVKAKPDANANNINSQSSNNKNGCSQLALPAPVTEWICVCGHKNDKTHVICGGCFMDKGAAAGGNDKNTNKNNNTGWKCLNCGTNNDETHVICGGCFCDKDKAMGTGDNNDNDKKDEHKHREDEKEEDAVHFEVDLLCYNGLPPSGPLLAPISINIITEKKNANEKQDRDRVIDSTQVLSMIDNDEEDENKKLKYIKGHALVQRIESKQRKNVYYYEIAISLESHFEDIQNWKSPYFMKMTDAEWKKVKEYFDPKILPNFLKNTNYEYPSIKWRCCSCYLGDDMNKKYAGYNNLESMSCKACGKPMYEGLRTLIVSYEHVPFYIRESKIDKVYQNALVKLLKKRFRNLVVGVVDNDCLPVI